MLQPTYCLDAPTESIKSQAGLLLHAIEHKNLQGVLQYKGNGGQPGGMKGRLLHATDAAHLLESQHGGPVMAAIFKVC